MYGAEKPQYFATEVDDDAERVGCFTRGNSDSVSSSAASMPSLFGRGSPVTKECARTREEELACATETRGKRGTRRLRGASTHPCALKRGRRDVHLDTNLLPS